MFTENKYDIHERIFNYIVKVIDFINLLPKTSSNIIFVNQITRSVTSMGANDQEADGASSIKDFLHGFTIVRKESKETVFWLRIIEKTNKQSYPECIYLIQEGREIIAIISSIMKNTRVNIK